MWVSRGTFHLTPRALGKQICCENQSSTGFRQKQFSAEARLQALSTSSRIHHVGGRGIRFSERMTLPSLWTTQKEAEKSQWPCSMTTCTQHSELSLGFCISSPHHQGPSSSELQVQPQGCDNVGNRREFQVEELWDTLCEGDRILSPMPQTGFIEVHNVIISSSGMACFKAYKEENADRSTQINSRFKW